MSEDELWQQVYTRLKEEITQKSEYSTLIIKQAPAQINNQQVVVVKRPITLLASETLKKTEQKLDISFDIEIYTKDTANTNKIEITTKLRQLVKNIMFDELGMNIVSDNNTLNLDTNVDKQLMRFSCVFDKERKIIFRK